MPEAANAKSREVARGRVALSLLVPGLGQAAQGRYVTGVIQFGSVMAYLGAAAGLGGGRSLLLALLWNAWSVVDAYRHESDQ